MKSGPLIRYPSTIKNKLFMAFILLILLPFSIMNVYNFKKMESVLREKVTNQSQEDLLRVKKSFEDMMKTAYMTFSLLEQDPNIVAILQRPDRFDPYDAQTTIEYKFKAITNSLFISGSPVYYTVLDTKGHFYASYKPIQSLSYRFFTDQEWFKPTQQSTEKFTWTLENNFLHRDESSSPRLLSVSTTFKNGSGTVYAYVKASIDYLALMESTAMTPGESSQYVLLDDTGHIVYQNAKSQFDSNVVKQLLSTHPVSGYATNQSYIINYCYIPMLKWYLIKQVPESVVYAESDRMQKSFFLTLLIMTLAFVAITFFIASRITKPLKHIQLKMRELVGQNLQVRLPDEKYHSSEIRELTHTFNRMVGDMEDLIQRLKSEERQKESVHFQMLLSQTNPHFLLNTLNTIKWIALRKGDDEIADICASLGLLLEASLNAEVELIHLKEEIELVSSYMLIQNFRYRQGVSVHYDYDEALLYALVPKLSLQPLVENSIQHGFSLSKGKGEIWIRIFKQGDQLTVQVDDNGIGIEEASKIASSQPVRKRKGIGLNNLKTRLNLLFKQKAGLTIEPLAQGTRIAFHLPLLLSEPYQKE